MERPSSALRVQSIARLDLQAEDWHWPFAIDRRAGIDAHFEALRKARPQLWNGRVLLAREYEIRAKTLHARYFETDFASFIAWRDWGFPDKSIFNSFGMGALRGSDGAFVLGEMAAHTANAGKVYFPSGTPDPSDRRDGVVDLAASVAREVEEETGLSPSDYRAGEWDCVTTGQMVAMIRRLDCAVPAGAVQSRIADAIAAQTEPELSATHIVRGCSDISPAMPNFVAAYLAAQFDASAAML